MLLAWLSVLLSVCLVSWWTQPQWSLTHICIDQLWWVNSFAPGKFEWNFSYVIFQGILVIDGWGISCEIALIWMSVDFTDDQSTLVQVMAWCRQATSHYLCQCWPRSLTPYGVIRPQWVKKSSFTDILYVSALQKSLFVPSKLNYLVTLWSFFPR